MLSKVHCIWILKSRWTHTDPKNDKTEVSSSIKCTRPHLPPALHVNKSPSLSPTLQLCGREYSVFIRRAQASRESVEFGQRP